MAATLSSSALFLGRHCGYERRTRGNSSRGLLVFAKKKRNKPKDLSKQRDFEDGMMVWDDIFEKCCEDPRRASQLVHVATKGMEMHGRGCVLVREATSPVTKGAGTGFTGRARPLVPAPAALAAGKPPPRPAFYESFEWSVSYIPRSFILDPSLAPADENDPAAAATSDAPLPTSSSSSQESTEVVVKPSSSTEVEDVILVRRTDLLPVLRAMDRTRVLSLTTERILRDSISSRAVQAEDNEQDAGGEESYRPSQGEMVLLLSVEFDGRPIVGADVVQAQQVESKNSSSKTKWKLKMRDYMMF